MNASTGNLSGTTTRMNRLALIAVVLALVSVAGLVVSGIIALAVFAAGAGHVALQQTQARGERGSGLAFAALAISYLMASYGVLSSVVYAMALMQQT